MTRLAPFNRWELILLLGSLAPGLAWAVFLALVEAPRGIGEVNREFVFLVRSALIASVLVSFGALAIACNRRRVRRSVAIVAGIGAVAFLWWSLPLTANLPIWRMA